MTWDEVLRQIETEHGPADEMHVFPVDDTKEHEEVDCWCNPTVEYEGDTPIYVHNALDGRDGALH
jgi:hypothetical protein